MGMSWNRMECQGFLGIGKRGCSWMIRNLLDEDTVNGMFSSFVPITKGGTANYSNKA